MAKVGSPVRLVTMLNVYTGTPIPDTTANNDAIRDLRALGIVELGTTKDWEMTEKGKYLVNYLLDTTFPETVTTYSITRSK